MIEATIHVEGEGIEIDVTVRSAVEEAAAVPYPYQLVLGRAHRAAAAAFDVPGQP